MNSKLKFRASFLLLCILCIPSNVAFGSLNTIVNCASYIGVVWCLILMRDIQIERKMIPIIIFLLWEIVTTFINYTGFLGIVQINTKFLLVIFLVSTMIKYNPEKVIKYISTLFVIIMIVQYVSLVTHAFGFSGDQAFVNRYNYFLGIRVNINKIILFAIFMVLTYITINRIAGLIKTIIVCYTGIVFIIVEDVSTSIMGVALYTMILIISLIIKNEKMWRNLLVFFFLVAIGFAFLGSTQAFRYLLEDILNEGLTMNGRTLLWEQAINNIHGVHWIIGNGYGHNYLFSIGSFAVHSAHNQYLSTLFNYGIVGLALYFSMCYNQIAQIKYIKNTFLRNNLAAVLVSLFIIQIPASTADMTYYYIFYVITMNVDKVFKHEVTNKVSLKHDKLRLT